MSRAGGAWPVWAMAAGAVALGLFVQHQLGAPASALILQAAGAVLGAGLAIWLARAQPTPDRRVTIVLTIAILIALAAPLAFGPELEGARRWLMLGPLTLQPSMILLPLLVWLSRAGGGAFEAAAVLAAALLLAWQFDAAALSGLAAALLAAVFGSRTRGRAWGMAVVVAALAAWTWTRPDALPSIAYVEQVLPNAWAEGAATGVAAVIATLLMLSALIAAARTRDAWALAALYVGLTVAALVGNYPLPVVGSGASLMLGWLIAIGLALSRDRRPA